MLIEEPEGYRLPLRRSLTRPILLGGAPRAFAILNATLGAAIGFGLQEPLIAIPVWAIAQAVGCYAAAKDPWFLDTWPRALAKPRWFGV